jgi:hypothetical protein
VGNREENVGKKHTRGTKNSMTGTVSIVPPSVGNTWPSAYTHNDTMPPLPFVSTRFTNNTKKSGNADKNMTAAEPMPASWMPSASRDRNSRIAFSIVSSILGEERGRGRYGEMRSWERSAPLGVGISVE